MLKEVAQAALKYTLVPRMNALLLKQSYKIRKLNKLQDELSKLQPEIQEVNKTMEFLNSQIKGK